MKHTLTLFLGLCLCLVSRAQSPYFPPLTGNTWETTDPATLGWCPEKIDTMLAFLEETDSKAFLVLKDGKIVIEHYFGTFTQDSLWYWASAGKTITSLLTGIAQENGALDINQPSSTYMGTGWSSLTGPQEQAITVRHHLTMTTGLDDGVADVDCTLPSCLSYLAAPGTRWAYHNAPYTLLDSIIHSATGSTLNAYTNQKLKSKTGMTGLWVKSGYNNVYVSNARSMARYGLLIQNRAIWNGQTVLGDTAYFNQMTNTSQNINPSYGYLWWLAGKSSFMIPQSQLVFNGSAMPAAPDDMVAALGKNGQILNIVPSLGLVLVRMGNQPDNTSFYISNVYNSQIWEYMNDLTCNGNASIPENKATQTANIFPNPAQDVLYIGNDPSVLYDRIFVYDSQGREIMTFNNRSNINTSALQHGLYFLKAVSGSHTLSASFVKE